MNPGMKEWIRRNCPDVPFLKNIMAAKKLSRINAYLMPEADIVLGEASPESKLQIVERYRRKWPQYANRLVGMYEEYLSRLTNPDIVIDETRRERVLFDCFAYGFLPDEHFFFNLDGKTRQEKAAFASDRDCELACTYLNDIKEIGKYFDKSGGYRKYANYYSRDVEIIEKPGDREKFDVFLRKHPVFVKKKVDESRGRSVELVDSAGPGFSADAFFQSLLAQGKTILEERIIQSDFMAALNPSSVNTVRVMSFHIGDEVRIGPCFLKVGQGGSFVDNGGAGGILLGLDEKNGTVNSVGRDEFLTVYLKHPQTGIDFRDLVLPDWERALNMVREMAAADSKVRYIGWDLAHTAKGWIAVEANGGGQFVGPQLTRQKGIREEIRRLGGEYLKDW